MLGSRCTVFGMKMIRLIRILEVPLLLLVIAFESIVQGSTSMGIFLIIISIIRLWTNSITDNTIYKK
jgi:hypothetical protein